VALGDLLALAARDPTRVRDLPPRIDVDATMRRNEPVEPSDPLGSRRRCITTRSVFRFDGRATSRFLNRVTAQ
jgi:hypothetical protein